MKTITDDPEGFFDNGGWSFLEPESAVSLFYNMYIANFISVFPHRGRFNGENCWREDDCVTLSLLKA
jgi:hypothetical protein